MATTVVRIISNPASGDGAASGFVNKHVIPLIAQHVPKYELFETTGPGAAEEYARQAIQQHQHDAADSREPAVFIVAGGDGTVHELVNGIGESSQSHPVHLVLCPLGTANALYSTLFPLDPSIPETEYRLQGVRAYVAGRFTPVTVTKTSLYTAANEHVKSVYGVVVTSTALHAAILHSADRLRQTVKGIERFKVAAEENISHWCNASVSFVHPSSFSIYDPDADRFTSDLSSGVENVLSGPFAYFISTTNVDRLEPAFQISPLFTKSPPAPGELDLVVVRPMRDPALQLDNELARAAFAPRLMDVLRSAYQQGAHVKMRHDKSAHTSSSPFVVEYIRTLGWKWIPVSFPPYTTTSSGVSLILFFFLGL